MTGMMIGAAAQRRPKEHQVADLDYALMRESGIDHVRLGIRPPFVDESMGATSAAFEEQEREIERIAQAGLKVMAFSPFPGGDADIGGQYPAWGGEPGSEAYLERYEAVCAWLAERFRGVVDAWQIANELNRPFWAGDLTPEQAIAFLQHGGRGVRRGNPEALVGFNMAGFDEIAMAMYARLLAPGPGEIAFDYIGCDGYMEPDRWPETFARLKAIGDTPIIVQEFGYASEGITLTEEQSREHPFRTARDRCRWLGWPHMWGGRPHTPETQADYIAQCMDHFTAEPRVAGVIVWRWDDAPRCWLCGRPSDTCPGTGRWGLVDEQGRPKPSLDAFRDGAARLKRRASREEEIGQARP
jgi:hypothetical protein